MALSASSRPPRPDRVSGTAGESSSDAQPAATSRQIKVTGREVAAARLAIAVDKRLGRTTPDWIIKLSQAKRTS